MHASDDDRDQHQDRDRIRARAARESLTIDAYLQSLLDDDERRRFWASFDDLTPAQYANAVSADSDELDENFADEDRALRVDGA